MNNRIGKVNAAAEQLDWAIKLFLDHKAYIPAITLAGAAEEILGERISEDSSFRRLLESFSTEHGIPLRILSQDYLNKAKNWLKHWKDINTEEFIELDLEEEAIQYIVRAVANLVSFDHTITSETLRFFAWLNENGKDVMHICDILNAMTLKE